MRKSLSLYFCYCFSQDNFTLLTQFQFHLALLTCIEVFLAQKKELSQMHWYKCIFLFMAWFKVHLKKMSQQVALCLLKFKGSVRGSVLSSFNYYKVFPIRPFSSQSSTRGLERTWQKAGKCPSKMSFQKQVKIPQREMYPTVRNAVRRVQQRDHHPRQARHFKVQVAGDWAA